MVNRRLTGLTNVQVAYDRLTEGCASEAEPLQRSQLFPDEVAEVASSGAPTLLNINSGMPKHGQSPPLKSPPIMERGTYKGCPAADRG